MDNVNEAPKQPALDALLSLDLRSVKAINPADLSFIIVNETITLVPYRQAAFFTVSAIGELVLTTASGLVSVAEDSPYAIWLSGFIKTVSKILPKEAGCHKLDFAEAPEEFKDGWEEWLPEHLLFAELFSQTGTCLGMVMYAREESWLPHELEKLDHIHQIYGSCLGFLSKAKVDFITRLRGWMSKAVSYWAVIAIFVALSIPVRLSVLAPGEIIALNAFAIAAPQDGVISKIYVQPNSVVNVGDLLFSLDNTTVTSRLDVAAKALSIARADALNAQQRAFNDLKSKGEIASAIGRVREKEAELASLKSLMARGEVRAERDGIVIYGDPNDWIGRPVQTGERVMQLANPRDAGVLVWLPVHEALNLDIGAPMRLFLHIDPLSPLSASLLQTSFQPVMSPEGVSAYRIKGEFEEGALKPRIGLRSTVRISGHWATLGY
ncbi:MAG: HlyD family efflux transporter periplasmic adaptor subunit, partial [Nitrosomonadaceae bacterium]|nr:HlyD family efflux transporter periplasmic adaptor subunit [Nitrosomonadaceae bacterium]